MKLRNLILFAAAVLLLAGCDTAKKVPYMQNIDDLPSTALAAAVADAGDFSIKPGDMLYISVSASNNDAVKPFNKIQYLPTVGGSISYNIGDNSTVFYLVDDHGYIDFPVIGKLHIVGMTKKKVEDYIAAQIYPRYLNEMPGVECRIQNFRIFCIGEFGHPGVINAENGRLNLIEALALAGDLTLQGKRNNILLIRTDAAGQRTVKRINLNDATFMTMPEYNLQQNDILYAEPNESRARTAWSTPPMVSFGLSLLSTAMSLITFITVMANK